MNLGIDGLTFVDTIGRGGFGSVHRAVDEAHGREVAVKILPAALDDSARRQFDRERRAMGTLSGHPAIGIVHTSGFTDRGEPYIVMELLRGGSLADRIAEGPLAVGEVVDIGIGLADALAVAHEAGVLHLDVKPENILFSEFGTPKLVDFGIAALADDEHATSTIRATPAYAAPEVLEGRPATSAADVYSLAATLYSALMGGAPYRTGESALVVLRSIAVDPVPAVDRSDAPPALVDLLRRTMDKEPAGRPPSMRAFADELRRVLADRPLTTAPPPPPTTTSTATSTTTSTTTSTPSTPASTPAPVPAPPSPTSTPGPRSTDRDQQATRIGVALLAAAAVVALVVVFVNVRGGSPEVTRAGTGDLPGNTAESPGPNPSTPATAAPMGEPPVTAVVTTSPPGTNPATSAPGTATTTAVTTTSTTTPPIPTVAGFAPQWASAVDDAGIAVDELVVVDEPAPSLCVTWQYTGLTSGTEYIVEWTFDGELDPAFTASGTHTGDPEGSFWACVTNPDGLAPGAYEMQWNIDSAVVFADAIYVGGGRRQATVEVVNDTDATICTVNLVPPPVAFWGGNRLVGPPIVPGSSALITVATGQYSVRVLDCDDEALLTDEPGVDVFGDITITVS